MAHPTRKHSKSRRDKSRAIWKLTLPSLTQCPQCAQRILPHRVCSHCGYYRGRQIITVAEKKGKKQPQSAQS